MWANESVFYHIYPIGFCGAPYWNNRSDSPQNRLYKVSEQIQHMKNMGINALYIGPLFESSSHGYDTIDYYNVDRRLGTNEDFAEVCSQLHANGIRVVLDGVLNHVGRDFWAFEDLKRNREYSPYAKWFYPRFNQNNNLNDGFSYRSWEGHKGLPKLRLTNKEAQEHILNAIKFWVEKFNIDGLRLDVAHHLDKGFLKKLHKFCKSLKPDFWLMGEVTGGDYNHWVNDEMLDSVTNYEAYGRLFSSFNNTNLHEIAHNVIGQYNWYRGKHFYNFADNHDVTRIASKLKRKRDLKALYTLLFAIPGIPSIYYQSEFGVKAPKRIGDRGLRPETTFFKYTPLTRHIMNLSKLAKEHPVFSYGDYKELYITNTAYCFARELNGEAMVCAINIGKHDEYASYHGHTIHMAPRTAQILINGHCVSYEKL